MTVRYPELWHELRSNSSTYSLALTHSQPIPNNRHIGPYRELPQQGRENHEAKGKGGILHIAKLW
jgi:hypothetical protein